jgi:3-methyladenine DNA glycosylase AlkD
MPTATETRATSKTKRTAKPAAKQRLSFAGAMKALEKAGSAQTKKTYLRHGAKEPLFGVSFAALKALVKRIGVDQELARALWATGNFDAQNLAAKIADPQQMTSAELDRWARDTRARMISGYVAMLAAEGSQGAAKATEWLASSDSALREAGWTLVGHLALVDETEPDDRWLGRLAEIEKKIHAAPDAQRYAMNNALIGIGCRNAALRKAATAAAKRIGKVEVDHGDTACKTPDAAPTIAKSWAHSTAKGFASPAAHERSREPMRTRC